MAARVRLAPGDAVLDRTTEGTCALQGCVAGGAGLAGRRTGMVGSEIQRQWPASRRQRAKSMSAVEMSHSRPMLPGVRDGGTSTSMASGWG